MAITFWSIVEAVLSRRLLMGIGRLERHSGPSRVSPLLEDSKPRQARGFLLTQPRGFFGGSLCASSGPSDSTTARISSGISSTRSISGMCLWRRFRSAGRGKKKNPAGMRG
jgi:hypothetical protein